MKTTTKPDAKAGAKTGAKTDANADAKMGAKTDVNAAAKTAAKAAAKTDADADANAKNAGWLAPVAATLDTLATHGTDRYGIVHSPVWMSILDVETLDSPRHPLPLDEAVRVQRRGRRAPGGCNLFLDQAMLCAARRLAALTGDARHDEAARRYAKYYLEHFVDSQTGLLEWGPHNFVNCHEDAVQWLEGHFHEIHAWMPCWPILHECNPRVIEREIAGIWEWHCNHATAQFGRHPEHGAGCSFAMTGGEFAAAFAFMHTITGDDAWRQRALRTARVHWAARNRETNLIPNQAEWEARFDAEHGDTSISGLWCGRLLTAAEMMRNEELLELAVAELRAFLKYQWRGTGRGACARPWGLLKLDGTPVPGPRLPVPPGMDPGQAPYQCWAPCGELDLWPSYMLGYEFPQETALAYADALRLTGDPEMRDGALRWAELYAGDEAALRGRGGTYAQHYGMVISFFCEMARATNDRSHLDTAERYARQAADLLFTGKIFRGHPAKPYYEAADGVGFLCHALAQLHGALHGIPPDSDPMLRNV